MEFLSLWDRGSCTNFADIYRSHGGQILVKFFDRRISHNKPFTFGADAVYDPDPECILTEFLPLRDGAVVEFCGIGFPSGFY